MGDTVDIVDMVDMVDTVDTVDTMDTAEARGPLMPNLRPKPLPHPKLMLKLHHGVDTDTAVDTDTVDTDTVDTVVDTTATDTARGLLMPHLRPKPSPHPKLMLKLHHGVDTTAVDTDMVVTVTTVKMDTSG